MSMLIPIGGGCNPSEDQGGAVHNVVGSSGNSFPASPLRASSKIADFWGTLL